MESFTPIEKKPQKFKYLYIIVVIINVFTVYSSVFYSPSGAFIIHQYISYDNASCCATLRTHQVIIDQYKPVHYILIIRSKFINTFGKQEAVYNHHVTHIIHQNIIKKSQCITLCYLCDILLFPLPDSLHQLKTKRVYNHI